MNDQNAATTAPTSADEAKLAADLAASKAATIAGIKAKFDNTVDVKEVSFHFKTKAQKDTDGKTIADYKRPTVNLHLPIPSVEGVVSIFEEGGKGLELLMEMVSDTIINRARELVNEKEDITQENFPLDQVTWEFIANLPKSERRGAGIAKEVWEEFAKDYTDVMPAVTGKSVEQVGNAAQIYLTKFNSCKTNKPVLNKLKEQLGLYLTNSPKAEQFTECVEFLTNKADNLLKVNDEDLLKNL